MDASDSDDDPTAALADPHQAEPAQRPGDELGGGLGNTASGGASDG